MAKAKYLDMPGLTYFYNQLKKRFAFKTDIGAPLKASSKSEMTDTSKVYVYTGNESGMENGHWYSYNGSSWEDGGIYNSVAVETDESLSLPGVAADAAAVGEVASEVADLKSAMDDIEPISEDIKTSLLNCLQHVAWIDEYGQDYYDALYNALYDGSHPDIKPYWDYEWSATSKTVPDNFDAYKYNFTDYASENAMFADAFYVDFDYVGDCEILFNAKMVNPRTSNDRTPQISVRGAVGTTGYNGFKVTFQNPSGYVETNVSGTFGKIDPETNYAEYHSYRIKYENGVGTVYIDGVLAETGPGVLNNSYIYMTGIFGTIMQSGRPSVSSSFPQMQMAIKEIKFKELS